MARRGFTLVEVLFSVMVLGIGAIMVAAIFPVAAQQSRIVADDTMAAVIARGAVQDLRVIAEQPAFWTTQHYLAGIAAPNFRAAEVNLIREPGGNYGGPPGYGGTLAATGAMNWQRLAPRMIYGPDPRYAYVAMFSREYTYSTQIGAPYAQVFIVAVKSTIKPAFDFTDTVPILTGAGFPANLEPKRVFVRLVEGGPGNPDLALGA